MDYSGKLIKALELKYNTTIGANEICTYFTNIDGVILLVFCKREEQLFTLNVLEYFGANNHLKWGCLSPNLTFYFTHLISMYHRRKFTITEAFTKDDLLVIEAVHKSGDGIDTKVICKYDASMLFSVLKQLKGAPAGFDFDNWYYITENRLFDNVNVKVAVSSLERIIKIISTL